jgi:hypothetical protein
MYQLLCMSFDGDYITETLKFESIKNAWEYSNDLGSKWYFYPFHFVIKNLTIKDTPDQLEYFKNKRIITVCRMFHLISKKELAKNCSIDQFVRVIIDEIGASK